MSYEEQIDKSLEAISLLTHANTLLSRTKPMTLNNIVNSQSLKKNNYRGDYTI